MESSVNVLYDYVLWQTPIKLVVTLAFYAFAFKLIAAILRQILRTFVGCSRVISKPDYSHIGSCNPLPPSDWWLIDKLYEDDDDPDLLNRKRRHDNWFAWRITATAEYVRVWLSKD